MLHSVDRIETAGPDQRARRLVFSHGTGDRVTSAAVVKTLGIVEGCSLDLGSIAAAEADAARDRAVSFLGYRERSARELAERLVNDGYPETLSGTIVSRFVELGLVDDERFARMWSRTRACAGYGPRRISRELLLKGIADELVSEAISEAIPNPLDAAIDALRGRTARNRSERDKFVRKLVQRGFEVSTAIDAVRCERIEINDADEPFIAE